MSVTEAASPDHELPPEERHAHLGSDPIPIEPYVSPAYFEAEKRHIFKRVWQHVGRESEIPKPGDFFVVDLPASDASLIVIRGRDGVVRAMHNVCSHRLNKVVYEERGSARKLFCKFHGWSYETDGRLAAVPEERFFRALDREKCGLTPAAADVWQGFIFVNIDPDPRLSLKDYLGPMFAALEGYPFDKMTNCYRWRTVVNCNWKLALDAFQETYHVNYVHGRSIAKALRRESDGSMPPIDCLYDDFHRRLSMAGDPKTVYGNPKAATTGGGSAGTASKSPGRNPIGAAALRAGRGATTLSFDAAALPPGLNWRRDPDWIFDINVVFPDFYLSIRPNYFQAYNFRPIAHDKFLYDARVYYPEMKNAGGRFYQEYMKVALRDVLLEDLSTLEHLQQACETRAKSHMLLQQHEVMIRHNYWVVDRMIREGEMRDGA